MQAATTAPAPVYKVSTIVCRQTSDYQKMEHVQAVSIRTFSLEYRKSPHHEHPKMLWDWVVIVSVLKLCRRY